MVVAGHSIIPKLAINQTTSHLLQNSGVAILLLPPHLSQIHSNAFQNASRALDVAAATANAAANPEPFDNNTSRHQQAVIVPIPIIKADANSGSVTGYHLDGGDNTLSRYNFYQEGFLFSNGETFDIPFLSPLLEYLVDGRGEIISFEEGMNDMFDSMCNVIARDMMRGIARHLKIHKGLFEDIYGPMNVSSQWHVQRYVVPPTSNMHKKL